MDRFKVDLPSILEAIAITIVALLVSNMVGYQAFGDSLPGLLVLGGLTLAGYFLSYVVPLKKVTSVLWISILAILLASPISPVSQFVIESVDKINMNAIITPVLAYAGIIIGKDWGAFKQVGARGVVISMFVLMGTFLISSLLGDLFMRIFN